MTRQELAEELLNNENNIVAIEYENSTGDTIEVIYFDDVEVADIEDYGNGNTIRLQREPLIKPKYTAPFMEGLQESLDKLTIRRVQENE